MITKNNITLLEGLVAKYAMKDYERCNPRKKDGTPKYKKYHPYTLSPATNEAREMLHLAREDGIGKADEEAVKGYLLQKRLSDEIDESVVQYAQKLKKEIGRYA